VKDVFLVRHGATAWNLGPDRRYQGSVDTPLSPVGLKQASNVAAFFQERPIDGIISSPLRRAHDTALVIAQALDGPEVEVLPVLREFGFGVWEGKTWSEIDATFGNMRTRWLENPEGASIPGAESVDSLFDRAEKGLSLVREYPGSSLVVVSHGAFIRALSATLLNLPRKELNRIEQDPGSISAFRLSATGAEAIFRNLDPAKPQRS
jgi:broad specificity phosphatase PhoE